MTRLVDPEDLAGISEAAATLGLTGSGVTGLLIHDPTFPRPIRQLAATRLWLVSDLRTWQAARVKKPGGRPTNAERAARDER